MNRSKDLDTVAPDDLIIKPAHPTDSQPQVEVPIIETPIESKPVNPVKKSKSSGQIKPKTTSANYAQRVYELLGHTKSPFSSFLVRPKVLSFPEKDDQEEIYLALRAHWFTNIRWVATSIFMLFVPILLTFVPYFNSIPLNYRTELILYWYLFTFIFSFEKFLFWYFNVFLITNERVVDIDFVNLFNKHFAEADLDAIQDVSSSVKGIFATIFNFGDVLIQTASEVNQINFEKIPNPEKVIKLLRELRELEENNHQGGNQ